jgi:hypothetical protein
MRQARETSTNFSPEVSRVTPEVVNQPAAAKRGVVVHVANTVVHGEEAAVVHGRTKDRHKRTAERKAYVAQKTREWRKRRAAGRVSA